MASVIVATPGVPEEAVEDPVSVPPQPGRTTLPLVGGDTVPLEGAREQEEPQRLGVGWLAGGGVLAVVAGVGIAWGMVGGETEAGAPEVVPEMAVVEPEGVDGGVAERQREAAEEPSAVAEPALDAVGEVEGPTDAVGDVKKEVVEVEEPPSGNDEPSVVVAEPGMDDASKAVEPRKAVEKMPDRVPPPKPAGPPSDSTVKKKLAKKIRANCAAEIAGQRVTVSFFVTSGGTPSLMTATPKDAAGECAKQQVAGAKLRPRKQETPMKIVVE